MKSKISRAIGPAAMVIAVTVALGRRQHELNA
jgi:hypothetical protein